MSAMPLVALMRRPARVLLTDTEKAKAARIIQLGIARSGLIPKQVTTKDHGQFSRECCGIEKLSFHEMVATWPPAVGHELIALLAVEFGATVTTVIELKRTDGARC